MSKKAVVGLTYDLVSAYLNMENSPKDIYKEFDSEETVECIQSAIESCGYQVERIGNIYALVNFLAAGKRVDVVFNIAEGLWGRSREGQVPSLLEAYRIPYTFSDPVTLGLGLDKAFAKSLWKKAGLQVTPFCVVEKSSDFEEPLKKGLSFPMFVKPVREGSSKGINANSLVENTDQLRDQVEWIISQYQQPALVEEFLPGRELTVGVIGQGAQAELLEMLEIKKVLPENINDIAPKYTWLAGGKYKFLSIEDPELRQQLADLCVRAYQTLGCRDAARLDLRLDKNGQPQLLEINPLPGLSSHSMLPAIAELAGLSFEMFLDKLIQSALTRGCPGRIMSSLPAQTFQTGLGELEIIDVVNGQVEHLEDLLNLYTELFPQYSTSLTGVRKRALLSPDADPRFVHHQWVALWNGEAAGLVSFRLALRQGVGICLSIAIRPKYRALAWGAYKRLSDFLLKQMVKQMKLDADIQGCTLIGTLVEIEHPEVAEEPIVKKSRWNLLARYQEYGFLALPIVSHEPGFVRSDETQQDFSPPSEDAIPMQLCLLPLESNNKMTVASVEVLNRVVDALLLEHYGLNENHWIVQKARDSISN